MLSVAVNGRRFSTTQASMKDLIAYACMLHSRQIAGGPAWLETDKFDVIAEADGNDRLNQPEAGKMLQQLLADRFQLAFHRDRKELSVYKIVSANEGPKLAKSPGDANGFGTFGFPMLGEMVVKNATIAEFANFLQRYVLDRPVLDESLAAPINCPHRPAASNRRICSPPSVNNSGCVSYRRRVWPRYWSWIGSKSPPKIDPPAPGSQS
jgi:uncharacterized protein (TIGR03435 family)